MTTAKGRRISVIIPVYNTREYLHACIGSVLDQTFSDLELILVDDGSTDGCGEICDGYASRDSRVRVIHQENRGLSAARNAGLAAATGDYIAWLDSDDRFLPDMLEMLLDAVTAHGKQVAICNFINVKENGTQKLRYDLHGAVRTYTREDLVGLILGIGFAPALWANLMDRRLYEGIRFPEGKLFEDVRTTYRLYERADGGVFVTKPLLVHNLRSDSLSRSFVLEDRIDGCRGHIERYEDAVRRWPQYKKAMLVSSARVLRKLRRIAISDLAETIRLRASLREVCRFYRRHSREILPERAPLGLRMEFWLITAGNYAGFALSYLPNMLFLRFRPYLIDLRTPGLPPY